MVALIQMAQQPSFYEKLDRGHADGHCNQCDPEPGRPQTAIEATVYVRKAPIM